MQVLQKRIESSHTEGFDYTESGWLPAKDTDAPHASVQLGPSPIGGMLFVNLDPQRFPTGEPVAPKMASLFEMLDERWDLGIGELQAAKQVR